jgi:hypothetical protein
MKTHAKITDNKKAGKFINTDETGIFGLFCARHGTLISLISMKSGETMRYLDLAIQELIELRGYNPKRIHLFYDIACQYKQHVEKYKVFDKELRDKILYIIGQFHVYAHRDYCLENFNPSRAIEIGMIEGEAAERSWPWYRGISESVKGMHSYRRKVVLHSKSIL